VRPVDRHSPTLVEDCQRFIERQRLFGVLFLPPISENDDLAQMCARVGCGYVRMGSAQLDVPAHAVGSNDREAVTGAVDHLVAQGHRRIGLILGPAGFRSAHERASGFRESMARHGLIVPDELVVQGSYRFGSGVAGAEALLDVADRPTAIFCSNDEMAAGALHTARLRGLQVPDDLSLVGFDDAPIAAHIWPPMTTVRWPIRPMAQAAAVKLIRPDSAGEEPSRFLADLVTRASVVQPAG
jgi:LacI family transcriptional regulator